MKDFKSVYLALGICVSTILVGVNLFAAGPGHGGGGGGINVNGQKITFGSTELEFHETDSEVLWSKLPALTFLRKEILSLPLGMAYQQKLLQALLPQSNRKYYDIEAISNSQRIGFKKAYLGAFKTQMNSDKIEVYALTEGRSTYLLPDFYKISGVNQFGIDEQKYKLIRQASILFHEASWTLLPPLVQGMRFQSEYNFVIDGEIKIEKFLRERALNQKPNSYDLEFYSYLSKLFKDTTLLIQGAAGEDLEKGRLAPFLNETGELNGGVIVGTEVIRQYFEDCLEQKNIDYMTLWQRHIENLAMENPEVKLFQVLYSVRDRVSRGNGLLFQGTTSSGVGPQGFVCEILEKDKRLTRTINRPFAPWLSREDQKSGNYYKFESYRNQNREYLNLN